MIKLKWVAAAGVLVGVTGAGALSSMAPGPEGPARAAASSKAPPRAVEEVAPSKPKDAFEQAYALADGEDVKLLTGPAIEARNEHYKGQWTKVGRRGDPVADQVSLSLDYRWRDGSLAWVGSQSDHPALRTVFATLAGVSAPELEGDQALLDTSIPADFLTREGAPADRIVAQLEPILRRDLHLPVRLSLGEETRDAVVVRGAIYLSNEFHPPELPRKLQLRRR